MKALRDRTGAGMMDCKAALQEASGDMDKAIEILRVKGQAQAAKRSDRAASEGAVGSYIHATGKIGVLVEVNCETDFVARNDDFQEFVRDVALHIAATAPLYVSEDEVPEEARAAEMRIFEEQVGGQARASRDRRSSRGGCASGSRRSCCSTRSTSTRQARRQDDRAAARRQLASKTGENIVIRRFTPLRVGEE